MPRLYDTRFFTASLYSGDHELQAEARNFVASNKEGFASTVTIHEPYLLTLAREGQEVAKVRITAIHDLFRVINVTEQIALLAAEKSDTDGRWADSRYLSISWCPMRH
jgi:hypothetical protein